jgi:type II secretory pathway component PulJ
MRTLDLQNRRGALGFTLIELMIVCAMTTLLAVLFSSAWAGLGRPSVDAIARSQIAEEAQVAAASLAADLGGSLPGGTLGAEVAGRMVGWMVVGGSELWICFDGGGLNGIADWGDPDVVITYTVEDGRLVRTNQAAGTTFVVASRVSGMRVSELGSGVQFDLGFAFRDFAQTYTLVTQDP